MLLDTALNNTDWRRQTAAPKSGKVSSHDSFTLLRYADDVVLCHVTKHHRRGSASDGDHRDGPWGAIQGYDQDTGMTA